MTVCCGCSPQGNLLEANPRLSMTSFPLVTSAPAPPMVENKDLFLCDPSRVWDSSEFGSRPGWFQLRGHKVEGWVDPFYSTGCVWSLQSDPLLYSLLGQANLTSSVPAMLTSCHQVQQVTTVWFTVPTSVIKTSLVNQLWMWRWEMHPTYD